MNKLDRELDFLDKFNSGHQFNEKELYELTWKTCVIDEIKGEDNRWTRSMETIFKIGNRCFAIHWNKGLTEMQEDSFYNQPIEVFPHEEIITKTTWLPIDKYEEMELCQPIMEK